MIHFFHRSHAKNPESGLSSDWIGNNSDDLRCSDWPSLHFSLRNVRWPRRITHAN